MNGGSAPSTERARLLGCVDELSPTVVRDGPDSCAGNSYACLASGNGVPEPAGHGDARARFALIRCDAGEIVSRRGGYNE